MIRTIRARFPTCGGCTQICSVLARLTLGPSRGETFSGSNRAPLMAPQRSPSLGVGDLLAEQSLPEEIEMWKGKFIESATP